MKYKVFDDKILITDLSDFDIEHILECGQIFTYEKIDTNIYKVFSKDKFALVKQYDNSAEIITDSVQYFINFFDLETDYCKIKKQLEYNDNLKNAIQFGHGIRIVKQDILEVIIGFIISANNNIERIKKTMAKLRQYGENMGTYFAFPSLSKLKQIKVEDFKDMGAGYRAEYLVDTISNLENVDFEHIKTLPTNQIKSWLLSLKGVGPKVADCILLFGFSRCESFPVDTWIEKVYIDIFKLKKPREKMSEDLVQYFGNLSGYAQQYLFFYKRNFS